MKRISLDARLDQRHVNRIIVDLLARLPGAVERQVYAMRVAEQAGVSADAVSAEVERRRKRLLSSARRTEARESRRPEQQLQPEEKSLRYEDPASAAAEEGLIRLDRKSVV